MMPTSLVRVGIDRRHGDEDIHRVVIFVVELQRLFQRHQRKTGFS